VSLILIGELALWVALLMAAWCATVSFAGGALARRDLVASGERAMYVTCAALLLASIGLWTALLSHDFSLTYVAAQTSANVPKAYVFTAFWSGQAGSMLFWALVLSMYSAIVVFSNRRGDRDVMPWATGTLASVLLLFLLATCIGANPYTRVDSMPVDGKGMDPRLQSPIMAIRTPNLFLGYVATTIPFAFAVAGLMSRRPASEGSSLARRWALLSWFLLAISIVLGMWRSYVELGWRGHWTWDPVENASLLAWLAGAALLHSILVQETRRVPRQWSVTLAVAPFLLSIFGTFVSRSGVILGAHSFAPSSVGSRFATFFALATVATIYLVASRLHDLAPKAGRETREAPFLYDNLVFVEIAFAVLWGTLFPILSEWVRGSRITIGPPFFAVRIPLGLLLLGLTGVGPLIPWRTAPEGNRRRHGGYVVHAGMVILVAAFAGPAFRSRHDVRLGSGDEYRVADPLGHQWRFVSQGASVYRVLNRDVSSVTLDTWRDGVHQGLITSESRQYVDSEGRPTFEPATEVGVRTTAELDTYLVLAGARGEMAELRITFNPLVVWILIGGLLMAVGGLIVMWPHVDAPPRDDQ
jgi:cytochrome c-type biogenesis protein CcmF